MAGDNSPFSLCLSLRRRVVSHEAMLQDSLQNSATPIRVFLLAVSFGLKSWGLFKATAPLEK